MYLRIKGLGELRIKTYRKGQGLVRQIPTMP